MTRRALSDGVYQPPVDGPLGRGVAGHRLSPHTADWMVEAWGPDRLSCLVEALKALVEVFAEPGEGAASFVEALSVDAAPDAEVLVALFEEVIYLADVLAVVPVKFDLAETEGGGVAGRIEVVPATATEPVGPVPKAVSYHDLQVVQEGGAWRCRAVVDV